MAAYADTQGVEVLVNVYKAKKYAEAFQIGKQVLETDPDNIKILTALGYAGMPAASTGDNTLTSDAITYAKKAIQLIEGGKKPANWKPFASRDETLGWLNYSLGVMVLRSSPSDSIGYLTKAAQLEGAPKRDPVVYYYLAVLYGQVFEKQRAAFKDSYEGKPETPESKVALEKVGSVVDLIIDAYARAISYTDASPLLKQTYQQQEVDWLKKLSELYKSRHNGSDAGLKEMISGIQSKPLPGQQSSLVPMAMP
jgi:tetratricopeptide (TPR) repeat protein